MMHTAGVRSSWYLQNATAPIQNCNHDDTVTGDRLLGISLGSYSFCDSKRVETEQFGSSECLARLFPHKIYFIRTQNVVIFTEHFDRHAETP